MNSPVLRDAREARRFLAQGLWWQRMQTPAAATVRSVLEWALEISAAGHPLPPLGFLADLGHLALSLEGPTGSEREAGTASGLPLNLLRTYEDHVLGKLYTDWTFARASDALRRYEGRERARALAFLLNQFRERAGFAGVELSPGILKTILDDTPGELLGQGWESLQRDGPLPLLVELYESLIVSTRRGAEILGPEDVFELENRTALQELGERLALRQTLQAAASLENALPRQRVRPMAQRREVPTRILDEDTYPVGGFSSLSTRGSIESLLHSQLAYMERDERPDLFDIKFLRDELLYYSRDENQFLRRRHTFVFILLPDLRGTRYKDSELPYQRGILLLALLFVAVRKLTEWLSTDALSFQLLFVTEDNTEPLAAERALLETLLREPINNGIVTTRNIALDAVTHQCDVWGRRSLCQGLVVGVQPPTLEAEDAILTRLHVSGPRPVLGNNAQESIRLEGDEPVESWSKALEMLLREWI